MPQHIVRHLFRRTRYVVTLVGEESGERQRIPWLRYRRHADAQDQADELNTRDTDARLTHWEVERDG